MNTVAMMTAAMADTDAPAHDYRVRRGELSAFGRALNSSNQLQRLVLGLIGMVAAATVLLLLIPQQSTDWLKGGLIALAVISIAGSILVWFYAHRHFIEPDLAFRKWLQQVCDGDLDASIGLPTTHAHYKELHFHTRNLATNLSRLSTDMENLVDTQTERLAYQNKSLDLLYHLTADVARETDQRAVLTTVCRHLSDWIGHAVVSAYLVDEDPKKSLSVTFEGAECRSVGGRVEMPPFVDKLEYDSMPGGCSDHRFRVPFHGQNGVAGMLVIETHDYNPAFKARLEQVLNTVAEQLSLFLAKQSALEQTRTAQMVKDRNVLAAEIHDSLAQTLAALRYHAKLLQESLDNKSISELEADVIRIQGTIGEANEEVRGLIKEFRYPLSQRRFAEAIRTTVDAFRDSSGMQVFFQTDDPQISFSPREESQLQRIIGEALNNAAKYSQAAIVRVYLRTETSGIRRVLIEDDGIGFVHSDALAESTREHQGKHIGLTIMQERASSVGATLTIETEPGEGTRVSIELPPPDAFSGVSS